MKMLFSLLLVLMMVPAAYAGNNRETWGFCKTAEDCVIVGAGCAIAAVHKNYEAEADKYYSKMNMAMDCAVNLRAEDMIVHCSHQRQACKTFWGKDDPESTCVSARKLCSAIPRPVSPAP